MDLELTELSWTTTDRDGRTPGGGSVAPDLANRQSFVFGPENEELETACAQVLAAAGDGSLADASKCSVARWLSPLSIFGPTGSGKSHLIAGLTERLQADVPDVRVLSFHAADLNLQIKTAIGENRLSEWEESILRADALIIEDLDRIAPAAGVMRILTRLLDDFCDAEKLIVVTSQRHPATLPDLDDALVSRLQGGTVVPVAMAAETARTTILNSLLQRHQLHASEEEIQQVINTAGSTPRGVQGWVHQRQLSESAGSETEPASERQLKPRDVVAIAARFFEIPQSKLKGKSRHKTLAHARAITIFMIRTLTPTSLAEIGRLFDNRDHSTVLHAYNKVEKLLDEDSETQATVTELRRIILGCT